jgi:hypothetical protein
MFVCRQYSDQIIKCFAVLPEDPPPPNRSVCNVCVTFGSREEVQTANDVSCAYLFSDCQLAAHRLSVARFSCLVGPTERLVAGI